MSIKTEHQEWADYLNDFNRRNKDRLTRVELFDKAGVQEEANHVPLSSITLETQGENAPRVEIMLIDSSGSDVRHFTHTITRVRRITPHLGKNNREDALEIEDAAGALTLMRFQS
ncbi:MAG: DUF5335 family protein [Pyrinomonadaceae bacterium]|nr:DUF5335 family protein [Pyrinomonadaceae bacterium]